jgi:hypothetical protein
LLASLFGPRFVLQRVTPRANRIGILQKPDRRTDYFWSSYLAIDYRLTANRVAVSNYGISIAQVVDLGENPDRTALALSRNFHMLPRLPYSLVSRLLGLLLIGAGVLKCFGLGVNPVAPSGVFSSPAFQIGLIQVEVVLGVWLLWGRNPISSWISALVTFTSFTIVSFYLGWLGQSSCGCFGALSIHPWYAFCVDMAAVLTLLASKPGLTEVPGDLAWHWA